MKEILVIGGGSIGERHVRCFQNSGRATVSLCEINDDLRETVAERYQLQQSFHSLESALNESTFDGAVICTPAHLHVGMAMDLVASGCGILIEKPLSISLEGTRELIAEANGHQLPVSVAYVLRQHPALQAIHECVRQQRFGRPVQISYTGGQFFPLYRPAYRETYYTKHETGGGAIQDALTHTVNAAEWIVGPITRLVADAEHCVLDGVDVEDTVHLLTRHDFTENSTSDSPATIPPLLGSFSLNQHQAPNESALTVMCENGIVRFESHNNRWLSCVEPGSDWLVEEAFSLERDDLFIRQANAFLDQLNGKLGPACSLEDALQTLRVNLATLRSVKSGGWEEL
ncbi:Gfo/Idh/MocA family protein [Thalassoroseus pseudoceratinae]|uniref:Gfo/Idh/MocA family protein n=1 Tax=Thalassoroseus pseudoceratinae TaxID=2713176 RepID=UPI001420F0D9|nr:Gfo/Idh/MocA family oxidoreductase [Thalassoroseus pseudoceratinae]